MIRYVTGNDSTTGDNRSPMAAAVTGDWWMLYYLDSGMGIVYGCGF